MQIHWHDFHDRPAPQGRKLLLRTSYGVIYTGEWRQGRLGEPQQMEYGWRADCCGRFSTPAYWAELEITDLKRTLASSKDSRHVSAAREGCNPHQSSEDAST